MRWRETTAGLAAATAMLAGGARAQPAPQYSASDFAKAMLSAPADCKAASEADCQAEAKTRGFVLPVLSSSAVKAPVAAPTAGKARTHASASATRPMLAGANILVSFAPGSAEITPQGRANLMSVAEGMKRPSLASRNFEVAGYTDPTGGDAKNLPLSTARAQAVQAFLVAQGVDGSRLTAAGHGADPLVDPAHPTAESNRRVELHRLN